MPFDLYSYSNFNNTTGNMTTSETGTNPDDPLWFLWCALPVALTVAPFFGCCLVICLMRRMATTTGSGPTTPLLGAGGASSSSSPTATPAGLSTSSSSSSSPSSTNSPQPAPGSEYREKNGQEVRIDIGKLGDDYDDEEDQQESMFLRLN